MGLLVGLLYEVVKVDGDPAEANAGQLLCSGRNMGPTKCDPTWLSECHTCEEGGGLRIGHNRVFFGCKTSKK